MTKKEKVNKVFRFEEIYNEQEHSLELDTYNALTLEGKKLTFQNFDFSDIAELIFRDNLEITRIKEDSSDGDSRFYEMPTTIEKITSKAVPNESDSQQLCLISEIEEIVFKNCILNALKINKDKNSKIKKATMSKSIAKGKFEILKKNMECLNLTGSTFEDFVDFTGTTFKNTVSFKNTIFEAGAAFVKCKFKGKTNFRYTSFEEKTFFNEAECSQEINLETATFYKDVDFLKIKTEVANRETARKIKNSFEKQNNIIEANKFYELEMKKREDELDNEIKEKRDLKTFTDYIIFKLHGISSNHSQDPVLPIIWIFSISFFYLTYIQINLQDYSFGDWLFFHSVNVMGILITLSLFYKKCGISHICKIFYVGVLQLYYLKFISDCSYASIFNAVADKINPFGKLGKDITFEMLIFKITIAYLIYQFIVSVRQNTRRS